MSTVWRMDLADRHYATLAKSADRIRALLGKPSVQGDPNVSGALDDFLGAIYGLILAKQGEFADRTAGQIEIPVIVKRAEQLAQGEVRTDGKWMAGFHFNGALFRLAAVYHRMLKVVAGKPGTQDYVPRLRTEVTTLYQQWTKASWSSAHIHAVHEQVNELKHTPRGVHDRRTVTYQDAIAAVGELLDLVWAWAGSRP